MYVSQAIARMASKGRHLLAAAAAILTIAVAPDHASADSAYIAQVPNQRVSDVGLHLVARHGDVSNTWHSPRARTFMPPPEAVTAAKQNLAQTYQLGSYNSALHLQSGANNSSTVGVIGFENNVAVLQSGNNLKSNVVLLNTVGLNVGVLQPQGSAPVNMLIARLPGGGLLIKR